jgi:sec-independent protein translocase protein TatB
MFNIGGGELIVILLIALIVLGPQRLPGAARQLGKAMGDLRRLSSGFQNEMKQALETADDPKRVTARRNVLATEVPPTVAEPDTEENAASPAPTAADAIAADAIAAVSAQPSAPGKQAPPASQERASAKRVVDAPETEDPSSVREPPAPPSTP